MCSWMSLLQHSPRAFGKVVNMTTYHRVFRMILLPFGRIWVTKPGYARSGVRPICLLPLCPSLAFTGVTVDELSDRPA